MNADKIVQALADKNPIHWGYGWEAEPTCFACESTYEVRESNGVGTNLVGFVHDPDCLWVQAREFLGMDISPSRVYDRDPIDVKGSEKVLELKKNNG